MAFDVADGFGGGELMPASVKGVHRVTVDVEIADGRAGHGVLAPMRRPPQPFPSPRVDEMDLAAVIDRQVSVSTVAITAGPR
jgi:hypothetical protein